MTRWLPTEANQGAGAIPQVVAAAEESNGDLVLETGGTSVTLSAPTDNLQIIANDVGLARYTSNGALVWGRDLEQTLSTSSQPVTVSNGAAYCPFTLAANGDIVIVFLRANPPPTGPVIRTQQFRLGRIDSNSVTVLWESTIPLNYDATTVVSRGGRNDFVTYGRPPDMFHGVTGSVFETPNGSGGTGATPNYLAPNKVGGAVAGKDGSTVWEWGIQGESDGQLNPWSSMTWTSNGFGAAAIIGAQDGGSPTTSGNGTELGPWWSEGDYAPTFNQMAVDPNGDLLLSVTSAGLTRFNGGMPLVPVSGTSLVKISGSNGSVLWQTSLPNSTFAVSTAPGNRVAVIINTDTSGIYGGANGPNPNLPQTLSLYGGTDGSLLTSFPVGPGASVLAPGTNDLYVLGVAEAAADYNPGAGTDTGIAPAAFFSRYTF